MNISDKLSREKTEAAGQSPILSRGTLIAVRGAGDLGSGVIHSLVRCGFRVLALETSKPTAIRTKVAFSTAVYCGSLSIEEVTGRFAESVRRAEDIMERGEAAIMIDPSASLIEAFKPYGVVDAILAKKNLGTHRAMAPVVIGLGPGFFAGRDVHAVIETNRGHDLGRIILDGTAESDTGVPGNIGGRSGERLLRSPGEGRFVQVLSIGSRVSAGDVVAEVSGVPITAPLAGVVRGLLPEGISVTEGFKVGDIDPRGDGRYCYTISDKSRALGRAALEAILFLSARKQGVFG